MSFRFLAASGAAVRRPGQGAVRASAFLLLFFLALRAVHTQDFESLRASLRVRQSEPDFGGSLSKALELAGSVEDVEALLREFLPSVRNGESRRGLFLQWAGILELVGRWEEAAARYEEAAFAAPGQRDTRSLLSGVKAWLAAGEAEKAISILKVLGVASSDPHVRSEARVLEGWARLLEGEGGLALQIAEMSVQEAQDEKALRTALVLLWASSEGARRKEAAARIRKEFPGSPEAAMAESGEAPPYAHWLLTRASGSGRPPDAPKAGSPVPGKTPDAKTSEAAPVDVSGTGGATAQQSAQGISAYQVGAFAEEANADSLFEELGRKGFYPRKSRRDRGGQAIWTVAVPAGDDSSETLLRLKDAGYEAYPLF